MQKFQEIFNFTREFFNFKKKNHQEDAGIVKILWYVSPNQELTRGVSHCGLAICSEKYLRQKKNYGNSNTSFTMQKYNLPKTL